VASVGSDQSVHPSTGLVKEGLPPAPHNRPNWHPLQPQARRGLLRRLRGNRSRSARWPTRRLRQPAVAAVPRGGSGHAGRSGCEWGGGGV